MAWHNLEENIKRAKDITKGWHKGKVDVGDMLEIIESMIEDAEAGHKRIKELEEEKQKLKTFIAEGVAFVFL